MSKAPLKLRDRFFFSHMTVMLVGVGILTAASHFFSSQYFVSHLQQMEIRGFALEFLRQELLDGFEYAWGRGAFWSVLVGASASGWVSYFAARRIVQPLKQIERGVQRLAAGYLDERLPGSDIPELDHLALSFNRMAADLERVEQRRHELIGDLTHELRTPLTVVQGYLEGLADGAIAPSPETYQLLAKEAKRLQRLVNDLQELSQAETGYLPIHRQPLDLKKLLEELQQRFGEQLMDSLPTIEVDCAADLPLVLADPERIEQVLINLIGNALRYANANCVTLRAWKSAQWVWVVVEDNGQGILSADLPYVFERFWRSPKSRTLHPAGTGVGLAISKRLIELQGGVIEVSSEVGKGSIFRFCLPVTQASVSSESFRKLSSVN